METTILFFEDGYEFNSEENHFYPLDCANPAKPRIWHVPSPKTPKTADGPTEIFALPKLSNSPENNDIIDTSSGKLTLKATTAIAKPILKKDPSSTISCLIAIVNFIQNLLF